MRGLSEAEGASEQVQTSWCVRTLAAAAQSLPGHPLYGLKQLEQQVRLSLASDQQDRAEQDISQLQRRLADLCTVINQQRGDAATLQALEAVATETRESQTAVAAVPAGAGQAAVQHDLANALTEEELTLSSGLASVDWQLRLAFTQQLGVLGEAIPTLTQVTLRHPSAAQITLTLTGTNFAPGVLLLLNGVPRGSVSQSSPTTLVVALAASGWPQGPVAVGVQNPDGTAAQITLKAGSDGDDDGDDQQPQGTPGATGTSGGDDDEATPHAHTTALLWRHQWYHNVLSRSLMLPESKGGLLLAKAAPDDAANRPFGRAAPVLSSGRLTSQVRGTASTRTFFSSCPSSGNTDSATGTSSA